VDPLVVETLCWKVLAADLEHSDEVLSGLTHSRVAFLKLAQAIVKRTVPLYDRSRHQ
jgi:hypothetical protein